MVPRPLYHTNRNEYLLRAAQVPERLLRDTGEQNGVQTFMEITNQEVGIGTDSAVDRSTKSAVAARVVFVKKIKLG